ncbi:unnamed protein product [Blepharisma stoltei]|uniref:EF-hand domain-containing protein n=1 Tax=Blepharisma stoltei TaxID=1481888 RepID=A0AAU9J9P5_9CILI|nr:unnamed protein product [Blepharisma stoltei]
MAGFRAQFENELRQRLSQKSTAHVSEETILLRAFKYFDLDNTETVDFPEFCKALEKVGMVVNPEQVQQLFNVYDTDGSGSLDYKEFTSVVFDQDTSAKKSPSKGISSSQVREGEEALEKLRQKLASRGGRGIIGLARQFKIIDDDNSKSLDLQEFTKAMRDFRVEISQGDIQALFNLVDRDRSGQIDYDEFLRALAGPMNSFRKALVNQAFNKLDRDNSGILDIEDIRNVYNAKGHPDVRSGRKTEEAVLGEFLETFEMHHNIGGARDQRVTREEFEEYYNNISCSIDNDQYFELMMNNTWKLSEAPAYTKNKAWKGEESGAGRRPASKGGRETEKAPERAPERDTKGATPALTRTGEALCEKFRERLAARGTRGIIGIQRQFKIMDDDGSKNISVDEFKKACHDFRVDIEDRDIERLFQALDRDRSGTIDYDELIRAVRGPMNNARKALVKQAWDKLDRDGSGIIDINDVRGVYDARGHPDVKSGKKTEDEILGEFLETFETHHNISDLSQRDRRVSKEEFEEYYNNVSASIDDDRYFELMMTNAWKLGQQAPKREAWAGEVGGRSARNQPPSRGGQVPYAGSVNKRDAAAKTPWGTSSDPVDYSTSNRPASRQAEPASSTRPTAGGPVEGLLTALKERLASRGARGFIGLSRSFKIMDDDGSKSLDAQEFAKAMRDFRVDINESDTRRLFNYMDADHSGTIDYEEFMHRLRGELNPFRRNLISMAFSKLDKNGNGIVEIDDIKGVYNATRHPDVISGKKTEDDILCEFLDTFETHHAVYKENTRDFRVTMDEFLEYYSHVSASIDDDRYFELMMKNSWNFEGKTYQKGWGSDMTSPAKRVR